MIGGTGTDVMIEGTRREGVAGAEARAESAMSTGIANASR